MSIKTSANIAVLLLLTALQPAAFAAGEAPAEAAISVSEQISSLEPITVIGRPEDPLTGSNTLDRTTLEHLPAKNGSINEAISVLPGVQLGDQSRTSTTAGEILPPNLSISGGRFYENNFLIDGIGNNSLLDPGFDNPVNFANTPGHPQELFVNPAIIEEITVYRSNISSRYGGFTGGVVETETRDPEKEFGGQISLRTTRSDWTEMHIDDSNYSKFKYSDSHEMQPKFKKYEGNLTLDLPITPSQGLLASYSRLWSDIGLYSLNDDVEQTRMSENFFLKYVLELLPATKLSISGLYAPYEGRYFLPDTLGSEFTNHGGGYSLTTTLDHAFAAADMELQLAWRESRNSRRAPGDYFIWNITPAKPWGAQAKTPFSKEGGYGNLDKEQQTLTMAVNFTLNPLETGALTHRLATGISHEDVQASFDRPETMVRYTGAVSNTNVVCLPGEIDCIANQQFMYNKSIHPADAAETRIRFTDVYLEDEILTGKFRVRPGVRVSHNDLMQNTDVAPRLALGVDLFGDGKTMLTAGYNRYFGKTFLTHALEEEKAASITVRRNRGADRNYFDETTNRPEAWSAPSVNKLAKRLSGLNTPYSDEYTVGLDQALFSSRLNLWYIMRDNEDELVSRRVVEDNIYTEWTNDGESRHDEIGLSWEKKWQKHDLMINVTWQNSTSSNATYIDYIDQYDRDDDGTNDPVVFNGKVIERGLLPRTDYNRAWTGNLVYTARLPFGLTFVNLTKYRSGYEALEDSGRNLTVAGYEKDLDVFIKKKQPQSWVFDWRLDWEKTTIRDQSVILTLEINNVFDRTPPAGNSDDTYELGRQFWLGATYRF